MEPQINVLGKGYLGSYGHQEVCLGSYGRQEGCRALMGTRKCAWALMGARKGTWALMVARKGAWASVKFLFCGTYMLKLPPAPSPPFIPSQ